MGNIITLLIFLGVGYSIIMIVKRKQKEIAEKEQKQQEMLFHEMQSLLKTEPTQRVSPSSLPLEDDEYLTDISEYYKKEGYLVTTTLQSAGIDLFGIRDNEALFIHCETSQKQIEPDDLKIFIGECTLYLDENPSLSSRTLRRIYATNRPVSPEAIAFIRSYPNSIFLHENH